MRSLIPFFLLNYLLLGPQENGNLIDTTCKATPNYQLCITTLKNDPRSSSADVAGLGLIIVDALKATTMETIKRINTLKKTNPDLRGPLTECGILYYAVMKADIPEAVEALTKGVPKFAEDGVADAAIEAQECERSFKNSISPLTDMNKAVQDLSSVARAIIRMLL